MKLRGKAARRLGRMNAKALMVLLTLSIEFFLLIVNSYFSYTAAADIVLAKTNDIEAGNLKQIDNRLAQAFEEAGRLMSMLKSGGRASAYLEIYEGDSPIYDRMTAEKDLMNYLSRIQEVFLSVQFINVFTEGHTFELSETRLQLDYSDISSSAIPAQISSSRDGLYVMPPGAEGPGGTVQKGFTFWSAMVVGGKRAYLLVTMWPDWLDELFVGPMSVVIQDSATGDAIWHSRGLPEHVTERLNGLLGGEEAQRVPGESRSYYMRAKDSALPGWRTITLSDTGVFDAEMDEIRLYSLISYLASMLICTVAALFFSRVITGPINKLMQGARNYRAGEPHTPVALGRSRMGLRMMFMLYFTLIAAVPLLVNALSLSYTLSGIVERKVAASLQGSIEQTAVNIDSFVDVNERITKSIVTDKSLREYLVEVIERGLAETPGRQEAVQKAITDSMFLGKGVFETSLYGRDGKILYSTSTFSTKPLDESWLAVMAASRAAPVWAGVGRDEFNRNVLRLYREVKDDGSLRDGQYRFKTLGYVCVTYYETDIEHLFSDIATGGKTVHLDDGYGTVISHRNKALVGTASGVTASSLPASGLVSRTVDSQEGRKLIVMNRCRNISWVLVSQVPYGEVMADNWRIVYTNIAVFAASLFLILIVSSLASRRITRPVGRLLMGLMAFSEGQRQVEFAQPDAIHEIGELGAAFDKMARQINELIDRVYESKLRESELETERRQSELIALRAQINPHFLYNTLESIIWLVKLGNAEKAADMLSTLGDFFRTGVKKGNEFVTLAEEIEFERIYLSIYEGRLGSKLAVEWDIEEAMLQCRLPRTILQPILENAIYHGIQENEDGGTVMIRCFGRDGLLAITVHDNGPGIRRDRLEDINMRLKQDLAGDSIGIYNVQKRLHLYYGSEFGISIESAEGEGTTVTMLLPERHEVNNTGISPLTTG